MSKRQFEKKLILLGPGSEKSTELGMHICASKARSIPIRIRVRLKNKLLGKKQNLNPMWKKLMKLVDLGEPQSFLHHVYLGCTQRECKSNETLLMKTEKMFES